MVELLRRGAEGLEEEVIIVRHARVVEQTGVHGVAGELDGELWGFYVLDWFAGHQLVELLDDHALICSPCYFVSCLTEEPWYAFFFECLVMVEFGESVFSSSLGERLELLAEGGFGLALCQCWRSRGDIIPPTHAGHVQFGGDKALNGLAMRLVIIVDVLSVA